MNYKTFNSLYIFGFCVTSQSLNNIVMNKILLRLFIISLVSFTSVSSFGQNSKTEQLEMELTKTTDFNKLLEINKALGKIYYNSNPEKAIYYIEKAYDIAKKNNLLTEQDTIIFNLGYIYSNIDKLSSLKYFNLYMKRNPLEENKRAYSRIYNNIGRIYFRENNFDSSEYYYFKSIEIKSQLVKDNPDDISYKRSLAYSYTNLGSVYLNSSNYTKAIDYLYKSLNILKDIKDTSSIATTLINLGSIHYFYGDTTNAKESYTKALFLGEKIKNKQIIATALTNLGAIEKENKNYDKADSLYNSALLIRLEIGSEFSVAGIYENIAIIAKARQDYDKALYYYEKSLKIKSKRNNDNDLASIYANLGNLYQLTKDYPRAEKSMISALNHAKKAKDLESQIQIYQNLTIIYEAKNDLRKALDYFIRYKNLDDSVHTLKAQETINLLKEQFETAEKDRQISEYQQKQKLFQLTQEKQKLNNRLLIGLAIFVLFISIAIIIFINNRRKGERLLFEKNAELNRQKMLELVKEQEMKSVNSFINGQEKERSRIASDLHDRLGSLLSTVKLHFSSIEPYFDNEPELSENFSYAISLLDQSVSEVRAVSHNLSKEILTEFGLVKAIENLAESINSANILNLVFINSGFDLRLSYEKEIEIYRIIQELVTNAIKHANAKELVIQFVADEENLSITIEDDGIGFDINKVKKEGMGLHNIYKRTTKIKGKYSIDSSPGSGSTFVFEIPIIAITKKSE